MSWLTRIFRRPTAPPTQSAGERLSVPENPDTQAALEEQERLERERRELEQVARAQQASREQEQAARDERVDQVMSKNSEEFLRRVQQPDGE